MVIYMTVYNPGVGSDNPLESKVFQKYKYSVNLVICCKFFPSNYFVIVYPIQTHRQQFDLAVKRSRSTQGHHLYKLCRAQVLNATCQVSRSKNFRFWRRFLKVFTIYGLGHVTRMIFTKFMFLLSKKAPHKICL